MDIKAVHQKYASIWMALLAIFGAGSVRAATNVWTSVGASGGPVAALAADPQSLGTVYAATGAGLFRSADGGASWGAVNPGPPCCISTLVFDPQSDGTIYASTRAGGVFQSTDGGVSWNAVNNGLPFDSDGTYAITALAMDPQNSATLYAGNIVLGRGGVFKTIDGGASWNAVSFGLPDSGVIALAINPQNTDIIFAATRADGLFQSTDGGASWTILNTGLPVISALAIDPQNTNTMYAAAYYGSTDDYSALFRTVDAGASWTQIGPSYYDEDTGHGIRVIALATVPQTAGTVYAATSVGLYKSTDSGASWTAVKSRSGDTDSNGQLTISAVAIDPQSPDTVYAAETNTGIFKSTDAGLSWTSVNSALKSSPASIVALKFDPQTPGTMYVATDVGGLFKTTDAGTTWTGVNDGFPDPKNILELTIPVLDVAPQNPSTLYAVYAFMQDVFRSTDGGASWNPRLARGADGLVVKGARLTTNDLKVDPRDPNTIYAAGSYIESGSSPNIGKGVFKSTNGAQSWTLVSSGVASLSDQSVLVTSLAIDPRNSSTVYAGTWRQGFGPVGPGIFKTTNGGESWKSAGLAGSGRAEILAIDPQNTNTLYARTASYSSCCLTSGLFKTTDGGASWKPVNAGLPNYVTALAIDPQNSTTLYAAGSPNAQPGAPGSGVFQSTDGGASWNAVSSGLPTVMVTALAIDPSDHNTLYAGTAGAGVFAITFTL
jgi:photosystem II stability/assembly factor-like uncharacterized protein